MKKEITVNAIFLRHDQHKMAYRYGAGKTLSRREAQRAAKRLLRKKGFK